MSQGFTSQLPVPLPVAQGGSGLTSTTAYAVVCGGTTSTGNLQSIAGVGTSGQVLTSNGAGALPTFQAASGPVGSVLQTVSTALTTAFSTSISSGSGYVDITGLDVTITPASTSNKVLISGTVSLSCANNLMIPIRILRGSTVIGVGTASGSRGQITSGTYTLNGSVYGDEITTIPFEFLDSPSTTSSTTYKIQIAQTTTGTSTGVYVNRTTLDSNAAAYAIAISVITVQEIKG